MSSVWVYKKFVTVCIKYTIYTVFYTVFCFVLDFSKMTENKITKQRRFVDEWLSDPLFKEWLHKDKNDNTIARCFICSAKISLSTAGRSALVEHSKGKKHSEALSKRNNFFSKNKRSVESNIGLNINSNTGDTGKDLPDNCNTTGGTQITLKSFVSRDANTKAEIIWVLKCVTSGFSNRSCDELNQVFTAMFPDSEIAKHFKLGRLKATYLATYGIAPLFKNELKTLIKKSEVNVLSFDESLNELSQSCEMDIIVRFWDNDSKKVQVRYWDSSFFGHARHNDLLKHFQEATEDLDPKKLYQILMDGPKLTGSFMKN